MSEMNMTTRTYVITGKHKNKTILRKQRMLDRYFEQLAERNRVILELRNKYPSLKNDPSTVFEAQLSQDILNRYWCLVRSGSFLVREIAAIERSTPEIVLQVGYNQYGTGRWYTHWPVDIRR